MSEPRIIEIEVTPQTYAELFLTLKMEGHGHVIGEDGTIRFGLARIKRRRPPRLDDNGRGVLDGN